jgi:hypothetical protein
MDIPVVVGNRLRFRIRWRLLRVRRHQDGLELGIWGHPALRVAMTPAGFEFTQIDWYTFTASYKRRRVLQSDGGSIEPARFLVGVASGRLGFVYLGIYLSDWSAMFSRGDLPLEIGRMGLDRRQPRESSP